MVWSHDRCLTRKTRHMAALAGNIVKTVGALLPFVIGPLDRHTAERVRDIVADSAKVRARVQSGIYGVVIGRNGIFTRAELSRFTVRSRAQDIGAVIEARAGTNVVAGLAIDPRHWMIFRADFYRGTVDLRIDLPGRETDRGMAAGVEVIDLPLGGRTRTLEQGPIDGFIPGLGHHRRAPLLVNLRMASATYLGIVEVFYIQNQVSGGIGPMRKEVGRGASRRELLGSGTH